LTISLNDILKFINMKCSSYVHTHTHIGLNAIFQGEYQSGFSACILDSEGRLLDVFLTGETN